MKYRTALHCCKRKNQHNIKNSNENLYRKRVVEKGQNMCSYYSYKIITNKSTNYGNKKGVGYQYFPLNKHENRDKIEY